MQLSQITSEPTHHNSIDLSNTTQFHSDPLDLLELDPGEIPQLKHIGCPGGQI
jgi:hypothetical protein